METAIESSGCVNGGEEKKRILLLPWLAHGHISPFFELAIILATKGAVVYICSTPATLASIRNKAEPHHIHLVDLLLDSPPELPPHLHTTNGLPLHLNPLLKTTFDAAGPLFSSILHSLSPHLLLYDFLLPWAPPLAAAMGIPSAMFFPGSAAAICYYIHFIRDDIHSFPFASSIYLRDYELQLMHTMSLDKSGDGDRFLTSAHLSNGVLFLRSFPGIEKKYFHYLEALLEKKIVPIGALSSSAPPPLFPQNKVIKVDNLPSSQKWNTEEIKEWLDGKGEGEVVFVSFGTEYFLSKEEMEEVAWGLEMSGVSFIWAARFRVGEKRVMPEGFMEKVEGRGVVVEWAAQREILEHKSIGGIVTHCGWGSVMEAIGSGVGVVAVPMHLDQFFNCRLVVECGVGMEVERDEEGRLERVKVGEVINEVVRGKKGEGVRRKVKEIMEIVKRDKSIDVALDFIFHMPPLPPAAAD